MKNQRAWKKAFFVLATLVLILSLSSCASMEEKRDKFMAQGKASFEKGDYVTARLHFKNALQLDPKLAEGYLWLGKTELRLKNPRSAFGSLSKAVELNPDLFEAQIILGNLYLLGKRVDEAESKANLILEKANVALLPGTSFGNYGEGYLRIVYANSLDNIKASLERIGNVLSNLEKSYS